MTVARARILKGVFTSDDAATTQTAPPALATTRIPAARRVPREALAAREEAARILNEARGRAAALVKVATDEAARVARDEEVAKLAAGFLALRAEEARQAENDAARTIEIAVVLAERLVGEALRVDPKRIGELAAAAIEEARGARQIRIEACPEDLGPLRDALGEVIERGAYELVANEELRRGSLIVHTDLGRVDARLEPQLERLAAALRELGGTR